MNEEENETKLEQAIEKLEKKLAEALDEVARLKKGIKCCEGTMIVDGNDMYDWGWLLPKNLRDIGSTKLIFQKKI